MLISLRRSLLILCAFIAAAVAEVSVASEQLIQKFIPGGITQRVGGYRPVRAEMTAESDLIKVRPEGISGGRFGTLQSGELKWSFLLVEPEVAKADSSAGPSTEESDQQQQPARLWVDSNADGDLSNDSEVAWMPREQGGLTMYSGKVRMNLDGDRQGDLVLYRFDPSDPRRAALASIMLYYTDFGFEYSFEIDGQKLATFLSGTPTEGARLPVDRDGNGRVSSRFEVATVGQAFNFTGSSWVFRVTDGQLSLVPSDVSVEQLPLPPDLRPGKQALEFTAVTLTGRQLQFPGAFRGRIVMLDFWATWCGPCLGEIPHMKQAYADWHEQGFDILGVSFDQEGMQERVTSFLEEREIDWEQIYEGKGWETALGMQHDVSSIPFVLLVDGDTGTILADQRQLRGPGLSEFIGKMLKTNAGGAVSDESE